MVGGPTVICIPASMTSLSRKRGTGWDLHEDSATVSCCIHRSFACVKIRASFHRENRLWSTFSKDSIRGSLHAVANTISALLSSGDRSLRLTAREMLARTKKTLEEPQENCGVPLSQQLQKRLFEKFPTFVNLRIIMPRFVKFRFRKNVIVLRDISKGISGFLF